MAIYIDEQQMIEQNMFLHEDRIKSPSSRFLADQTPFYVTYYHIDDSNSTTDIGFKDVYSLIGNRSPVRYRKIENFPLYGIEQVVLQLQDTEHGLDTSYESDATVLPQTIKPLMNDFFIIVVCGKDYIFRVNDIQYDAIMTDSFYKILFHFHSLEQDKREEIDRQVITEHVCVLQNVGTEENCLIEKQEYFDIKRVERMYRNIIDFYTAMFYSKRHNVFLAPYKSIGKLFDQYQTEFINKHGLFNEKNSIQSVYLTTQINDPKQKYRYNKSVYKLFEMRDLNLLSQFKFVTIGATTYPESSFFRWYERDIYSVYTVEPLPVDSECIFSAEFVESIRFNADVEGSHANLIKKFLRKEEIKVKDIPLTLADELIDMNDSLEVFFIIPLIMYVIRETLREAIKIKK